MFLYILRKFIILNIFITTLEFIEFLFITLFIRFNSNFKNFLI